MVVVEVACEMVTNQDTTDPSDSSGHTSSILPTIDLKEVMVDVAIDGGGGGEKKIMMGFGVWWWLWVILWWLVDVYVDGIRYFVVVRFDYSMLF